MLLSALSSAPSHHNLFARFFDADRSASVDVATVDLDEELAILIRRPFCLWWVNFKSVLVGQYYSGGDNEQQGQPMTGIHATA